MLARPAKAARPFLDAAMYSLRVSVVPVSALMTMFSSSGSNSPAPENGAIEMPWLIAFSAASVSVKGMAGEDAPDGVVDECRDLVAEAPLLALAGLVERLVDLLLAAVQADGAREHPPDRCVADRALQGEDLGGAKPARVADAGQRRGADRGDGVIGDALALLPGLCDCHDSLLPADSAWSQSNAGSHACTRC